MAEVADLFFLHLIDPDDAASDPFPPDDRLFDAVDDLASDFLNLDHHLGFDPDDDYRDVVSPGLRVVGFDSDSDSGSESESTPDLGDFGIMEEARREVSYDFEWEEVDDERRNLQEIIDRVGELEIESEEDEPEPEPEPEPERNVEWEVLLAMNQIDRADDFVYTAEDEVLFGQFLDQESSVKGRPPAAKSVIDNLPSIVLTQDDFDNDDALCAVCKDEIPVGQAAKQLPCMHRYHGECILPWLAMRNTCPVCRFELPSDDSNVSEESRLVFDRFEVFPED